jgi:hypothetical protein
VPKKTKAIPDDRAEWSFGDALYWHFFIHGTRPEGGPGDRIGRPWNPKEAGDALAVTVRAFWNWVDDRHLPYGTEAIERALFGSSKLFDEARNELRRLLHDARERQRNTGTKAAGGSVPAIITGQAVTVYATPFDDSEVDGPLTEADFRGIAPWPSENFGKTGWKGGVEGRPAQAGLPPPRSRKTVTIVLAALLLLLGGYGIKRVLDDLKGEPGTAVSERDPPKGPTRAPSVVTPNPPETTAATQSQSTAAAPALPEKTAATEEPRPAPPVVTPAPSETRPTAATTTSAAPQTSAKGPTDDQLRAAERLAKLGKDATDAANRERAKKETAASELNIKLKAMAQSEAKDLCKRQLEGLSAPGFDLKCDTLIPFGKLLSKAGVSQNASSLGDCAARCRKEDDCVAFSFDAGAHAGAASCYLTGSIPAQNPAKNWISGVRQ